MGVACPKCGNEELRVDPISRFRLGIPQFRELQQAVIVLSCLPCRTGFQFMVRERGQLSFSHFMHLWNDDKPEQRGLRRGHISLWSDASSRGASVDYDFVHSDEEGILWPMREARIQTGSVVDRYGDPDLMADFAREYLKQHRMLLRPGALPHTLVEVMPSLLLLVTAAELALKAFILRSKSEQTRSHDLVELYNSLDPEHQFAIEALFRRCQVCCGPHSHWRRCPSSAVRIGHLRRHLRRQARRLPGGQILCRAHNDAVRSQRAAGGANLIKGNTPYPTFMTDLVEAIVHCYFHFSGLERLRRRGAQIQERKLVSVSHGHGDWALRPSSLGLAVIVVSQQESKDTNHNDLPAYTGFKSRHPTGLQADWMYGGSTLLFYGRGRFTASRRY